MDKRLEEYVEKYATIHHISKEEAMQHQMVKEVAEYYEEHKEGTND